jgi:hypothetical protein
VDEHKAQAFETAEDDWVMLCATCLKTKSGLTADEAYNMLADHTPNPEAWTTPSGKPGYRTRRGGGPAADR